MNIEITPIPGSSESLKETLTRDLKGILGKADHLLKDASHTVGEELSATRHVIAEKACTAANATHEYVRGNPWKVAGVAAAIGVFIGTLISRR
jgi:ElaB/YqjD/DUF883 family membrane-anchored ribosome-binding protein